VCEIFFLYGRNGEINADSLEKLLKTALDAADRNSDGFGIFNDKKQEFKTAKKLKNGHIPNLVSEYAGSKFVVVHLRLATNGSVCQANAHPFRHENNLMVHNGVVRNTGDWGKDNTDSYEMMRDILDNREDGDTVSAIEDTMDNLRGRVSVFFHDNNHNLYYFRDTSTFTFAHNPVTNEYVGATQGDRLHDVWDDQIGHVGYFDNLNTKDPEEGNVLKITDDDIEVVGNFDMGYSGSSTYSGYSSQGSSYDGHPRRSNRGGSGKASNDSSQSTSDEEVQAACVLNEDEVDSNQRTLPDAPTAEEIRQEQQADGFSEEEYQRQKTGFTEDEWEEYMKDMARRHAPPEERERDDFAEMYDVERDYMDIPPETIAEEVYDKEPEDPRFRDEQEYWEQKEEEFFRQQEQRYQKATEEFDADDEKQHPLEAENEDERQVRHAVEQDISNDPSSGLAMLFEGSSDDE